jgi:EAL domain-containing protein (putative c-di-GMP-specific phosphodiesterase class I)
MQHLQQGASPLNIVLLSESPAWERAASEQASALGVGPIHATHSPQEAVSLLAGGFPPVSHLLLQPNSAGNLLSELVDMTAGRHDGVALVVLGEPNPLPSHPCAKAMTFVSAPSKGWLQRVLMPQSSAIRKVQGTPNLTELKSALADTRIQTRYQPIVQLDSGVPVGLEVLARLEHPQFGVLQPDLFIPQLEDAGLAWPLTEAVITRAFADWGDGKLGSFGLTMALNFPLDVLLIPEALTSMENRRREAGLPADRVVIELTESRPVSELRKLGHAISTLRGMGYGLAIDDVGPALRDHSALLDLQFTALKLDKDLVQESASTPLSASFLSATITSAHEAGLIIIAEGVEDRDIWDRMVQSGVDQAQGFLVARPLPAAAVPIWYHDWCARLER